MLRQTLNKRISTPIAIGIVLILVVLVGGFTWLQYGEMWREASELPEIELSEKKETELPKIELPKKEDIPNKSDIEPKKEEVIEEPYIKVISPKGGEIICIGEDFIIEWESKGVETVGIALRKGSQPSGGFWVIDEVLATRNETNEPGKGIYVWKAGYAGGGVHEGEIYLISVESGIVAGDFSEMFSLIHCEG